MSAADQFRIQTARLQRIVIPNEVRNLLFASGGAGAKEKQIPRSAWNNKSNFQFPVRNCQIRRRLETRNARLETFFSCLCAFVVLIALSACAMAQSHEPRPEQIEQLRKRAETAEGGDRAKLYIDLARDEIEDANAKFDAGNADQAQLDVEHATADAEKAKEAAVSSHKRLKQTQIAMHELARRLDGIEHSLAAEDRPKVKVAVDKTQSMATEILEAMFKKK